MTANRINRASFNSLIDGQSAHVYPLKSGIDVPKDEFVKNSQADFQSMLSGNGRAVSTSAEVPMPRHGMSRFFKKA